MKEFLDDLLQLCVDYDDDSYEQMLSILCGDEELDRGHSLDSYISGVEDGENSLKRALLRVLKAHGKMP